MSNPRGQLIRAGEGNRTLTASLEGWSSTIELHPHRRHCKSLVGLVGLEPTTSCSQSTRATKLRHSPNSDRVLPSTFLSQSFRMLVSWNSREKSLGG